MDTTPYISSKILTKDTTFTNYLLIVDTYSKLPIIYGMEDITTEKVMYKIDMFQASFGKLYGFGWWDLEWIQTDAGTQFTLKEFQGCISVNGVQLALASPDHQEMNIQVEVKWHTLRTIAHSIMVHARVLDKYIHFALMYTTHNIFSVLPIKHLIDQDGEPTT